MNNISFDSKKLVVDWISFNIQKLLDLDPGTIADRFSRCFTSHVLIDEVPMIGFHGLKKNIKFLSVTIRDPKVTGLEVRLFSLEKMRLIFINFSKLKNLIRIF